MEWKALQSVFLDQLDITLAKTVLKRNLSLVKSFIVWWAICKMRSLCQIKDMLVKWIAGVHAFTIKALDENITMCAGQTYRLLPDFNNKSCPFIWRNFNMQTLRCGDKEQWKPTSQIYFADWWRVYVLLNIHYTLFI